MKPTIDTLVTLLQVLGLGLAAWTLIAVFAYLVKVALTRLGALEIPGKLYRLARQRTPVGDALASFFSDASAALEKSDESASTRVALDRRHAKLKDALRSAELSLKRVSQSVSGLAGVSGPAEIGKRIDELDEKSRELAEKVVDLDHKPELNYAERAKRNFAFVTAVGLAFACSVVNGVMLSTFLREVFPIRVAGIQAAIPLAALVVILEMGAGFLIAVGLQQKSVALRVVLCVAAGVAALILALVEAVIFGIMSSNFDLGLPIFEQYPNLQVWFAPFGFAFVLLTTSLGYLLHYTWEARADASAGFWLARDLAAAKQFVAGLPKRWEGISQKAREAEAAIDDFVASLGTRSGAVSGSVEEIKAQRDALVAAIREAKVDDWSKLVAGGQSDARWASIQNLIAFVLTAAAMVVYSILVGALVTPVLTPLIGGVGAVAAGVMASIALLTAGQIAADKLEIVERGRGRQALLFPLRPTVFALLGASLLIAGLLIGLVWAGVRTFGWPGVAWGLLVFGLGGALVVCGHFAERAFRGLLLASTIALRLFLAVIHAAWCFSLFVLAWLVTAVAWLLVVLLAILVIPIEFIVGLFNRDGSTQKASEQKQIAA